MTASFNSLLKARLRLNGKEKLAGHLRINQVKQTDYENALVKAVSRFPWRP